MGDVLGDWRKASVTPIFKRGKKKDPGNYYSTSTSGKVMEYVILEVITKHGEGKDFISMDSPRGNHVSTI